MQREGRLVYTENTNCEFADSGEFIRSFLSAKVQKNLHCCNKGHDDYFLTNKSATIDS